MSPVSRDSGAAELIDNDLAVLWSKLADLDNLAILKPISDESHFCRQIFLKFTEQVSFQKVKIEFHFFIFLKPSHL